MRVEQLVSFSKEEISKYRKLIGMADGAEVVPSMMANLAYKQIKPTWHYKPPVVLRKLENQMIMPILAGTDYIASLEFANVRERKEQTFLEEHLVIRDANTDTLHFRSCAKLVTGGVIR